MNIHFPYLFTAEGQTAFTTNERHLRNMIEQILFTNPGERVNRPKFGSGLLQSLFEPNSNEMAATLQFLIQGSLNQWLGNLIEVNEVELSRFDSSVEVKISYTIIKNRESITVILKKEI